MTWLQKRLKELGYTHEDLQQFLYRRGIERSRATITGWTNGRAIPLLSNPHETKILAEILKWNTLELFTAAGYDVEIHSEMLPIIKYYNAIPETQRQLFLLTIETLTGFVNSLNEEQMQKAVQDVPQDED